MLCPAAECGTSSTVAEASQMVLGSHVKKMRKRVAALVALLSVDTTHIAMNECINLSVL